MLIHSLQLGRHSSNNTQFSTIQKQRSFYSNEYLDSQENDKSGMIITSNSQPKYHTTHYYTDYLWFSCWSTGFENRIVYILKHK